MSTDIAVIYGATVGFTAINFVNDVTAFLRSNMPATLAQIDSLAQQALGRGGEGGAFADVSMDEVCAAPRPAAAVAPPT